MTTCTPARDDALLDGLFTYCLSVLCDHDTATAALGDALAFAERRGARRGPEAAEDRRAWLYALARWSCLRKLTEARQGRQAAHAAGRRAAGGGSGSGRVSGSGRTSGSGEASGSGGSKAAAKGASGDGAAPAAEAEETARRRELSRLAWPEAAGTTPEQREALELAVRHRLAAHEVAAVLGMELATARDLLASAACEVERTRAALAVVETGTCPIVARLTGDHQVLLGTALRRELVRHVDDCPRCRRIAERAVPGAWPGTSVSPAALPVVEAPRAALGAAKECAPRARGCGPRFDRRGFPMDPKDHAARRGRLRARAVTTTVVATVVAAPVFALWAAYRAAPVTGEGRDGRSVTAGGPDGQAELDGTHEGGAYENAGNASSTPDARFTAGSRSPDVSVEVVSPGSPPTEARTGPGRLTVGARPGHGVTYVTLTASGGAPVHWAAHTAASWLHLSQSSGTVRPGDSVTLRVYVDHRRQPSGHWTARIAIAPSGAVVLVEGFGRRQPPPHGHHPHPTPSDPTPSDPTPSDPSPSDPPSGDPTPSDPGPSPSGTPTSGPASPPGSSGPADPPSGSGGTSPSGGRR